MAVRSSYDLIEVPQDLQMTIPSPAENTCFKNGIAFAHSSTIAYYSRHRTNALHGHYEEVNLRLVHDPLAVVTSEIGCR